MVRGRPRPRPDRRLPARQAVLDAIRRANLFATIVPEDTYVVASEVHDLLVKTHPADAGKIEMIKALVWEHLKIDRVLEAAGPFRLRAEGPARADGASTARDADNLTTSGPTSRPSASDDEI